MLGYGKGHGVIMDNHYQVVKTIDPAGPSMTVDLHEFNLTPDGKSALMTIYHPMAYDLHSYGIRDGMGWIQEGRFQEVDVESGNPEDDFFGPLQKLLDQCRGTKVLTRSVLSSTVSQTMS